MVEKIGFAPLEIDYQAFLFCFVLFFSYSNQILSSVTHFGKQYNVGFNFAVHI